MAEDLTRQGPVEGTARQAARSHRIERVLVGRFRLVYAALSLLLGLAVGGFIVLSGHAGSDGGPAWSTWKPSGDSSDKLHAIAAHVGHEYRVGAGNQQLVAVSVQRPPTVPVQALPVKYMVLSSGSGNQNILALPAEDTVAYAMCGNGQACSIGVGTPTQERGRLVRREALELALYTFSYVSDVKSVVVLLPPKPGTRGRFALFVTKDGLEPALDQPLARTLPTRGPLTVRSLGPVDTRVVNRYADPSVFQYSFGQARDGSVYMALQPLKLTQNTQTQQQQQPTQP